MPSGLPPKPGAGRHRSSGAKRAARLGINRDGRNGRTEFYTAVFPEENLGQLGNAKRRMFYGPAIDNFDLTLQKSVKLHEAKSIDVRAEFFNVFNHAQFYGPAAVDGQVEDPNYGHIVSAVAPRLIQLVGKFSFYNAVAMPSFRLFGVHWVN